MKQTVTATILYSAAIAGLLLASSCAQNDDADAPEIAGGECHGINSCKGKGACAGKDHRCAGLNSCKGQGWLKMTEQECLDKKGTFKPFSMEM